MKPMRRRDEPQVGLSRWWLIPPFALVTSLLLLQVCGNAVYGRKATCSPNMFWQWFGYDASALGRAIAIGAFAFMAAVFVYVFRASAPLKPKSHDVGKPE
jgi:hypothetical protein